PERLKRLEKELADQKATADALKARWQNEKNAVQKVREVREQIEQVKLQIEQAERQYDLNRAAELKYGKLPELERQLKAMEETTAQAGDGAPRLLKEEVGEEDIAAVVSRWTGVPVTKLLEGEKEKLLHIEDETHQRVIGQDEAVTAVSEAVIRARSGLKDPQRPIGAVLLLGHHSGGESA